MRMYDIITKKREGGALSEEEISFFVRGYVAGDIPDYQASALLMAICCRGMTPDETVALTRCMTVSGDTVDLSAFGERTVDKHSTGGVGDKTTMIIAPVAATLGATIAKISGRGLGHTGGTLDKLESIEGLRTDISPEQFRKQVETIGIAVVGQSGNLVPADKKLYALRDSTATVDSLPLIASSIMCKKLASGAKSIVLDVKTGDGAFMKTPEDATALARMMMDIGAAAGRRMSALITDMNLPLGCAVGNILEVEEALAVLRGDINSGHLYDVCVRLAAHMVSLSTGRTPAVAEADVRRVLAGGEALETFARMVKWQGGRTDVLYAPGKFPRAKASFDVVADRAGYIHDLHALAVGESCVLLGAGREKKTDVIDPTAGIILHRTRGDKVDVGEPIATLYTSDEGRLPEAAHMFRTALSVSEEPAPNLPLIYAELSE